MVDGTGGNTPFGLIKNKLLEICRFTMLIVASVDLAHIEVTNVFLELLDVETIVNDRFLGVLLQMFDSQSTKVIFRVFPVHNLIGYLLYEIRPDYFCYFCIICSSTASNSIAEERAFDIEVGKPLPFGNFKT